MSTSHVPINPDFTIPSVPQSHKWEVNGMARLPDGRWKISRVPISGWGGLVKVKGKLANGEEFPELKMGSFWLWIKDAKLAISTVDKQRKID